MRIIAFALAVIMFAFSGYFTSMFIKSEFVYNSFDGRPYLQTAAFRDVLNRVEQAAIYEGDLMLIGSVEEFEKTSYGAELKKAMMRRNELPKAAMTCLISRVSAFTLPKTTNTDTVLYITVCRIISPITAR